MKLLARHARRELYTGQLSTASALGDAPCIGLQFACLLWNHGAERDVDAASALLGSLIDGGCRYVVCAGLDCEWWHDLADELLVSKCLDAADEQQRRHVMTTWHAQESPDDVAFFFVLNTSLDEVTFDRFLVLHLGNGLDVDAVDRAVATRFAHSVGRDEGRARDE